MFKSLELYGWRQIDYIHIEFHPRLTILTGANGAGKTTLLNIVNRHYGWNIAFVSAPEIDDLRKEKRGILKYIPSWFIPSRFLKDQNQEAVTSEPKIGSISYMNGGEAIIRLPASVGTTYQPKLEATQSIVGLHIPSHRPVYNYQEISSIPTQPRTSSEAFDVYSSESKTRYSGGSTGRSANYAIKEVLLSLAMYGYGNQIMMPNLDARDTFEGFQDILRIVLPPKLGFERIAVENPEIVLITRSGPFTLDAVSGGVASIIDMAWQIYMFSRTAKENFVVSIDEPENHLHPELQQTLLPSFLKAFPSAQFIVATHNPLIIGSEPNSNVFALRFNDSNKVESIYLETADKTGTSNEILREVLGLPFTMPIWVNMKLDAIIAEYSNKPISEETFNQLRATLAHAGLEKYAPETIVKVLDTKNI